MEQFLEVHQDLNLENIHRIEEIYSNDIHFDFLHSSRSHDQGYVQWQMIFSHPRLKNSQHISVNGASFLKFSSDNKVHFHRDYFGLGSMPYQHLPLLGTVVKSINRRLAS